MYRIKNTAEDRTKHLLHRTAAKFELEPNLGGVRIRLGAFLDITDEHYDRVKPIVDEWVKKGMVEVVRIGTKLSDWKPYAADQTLPEITSEERESLKKAAADYQEELNRPVPVQEPEVLPEPAVIVEPEPPVVVAPPVVQAPPPPPAFNKPQAQDPNKNKKLR
jgi:hypothetical protein